MKKLLVAIISIIVLSIGCLAYLYYEYGKLDIASVPELSVTINQQEISQESIDWHIPFIFDNWAKPLSIVYDTVANPITIDTGSVNIVINEPDSKSTVNVKDINDKIIYTGTVEDLDTKDVFSENGTYNLVINIELTTADNGYGKASFTQTLIIDERKEACKIVPESTPEIIPEPPLDEPVIPDTKPSPTSVSPEYSLSQSTIQQGDLAVLTIKNVPHGVVPTAKESDLGYIRFAKTNVVGEFKAMIPTSYTTALGEYPLNITVGNQTEKFLITVTEENFEVQNLTISESISDDTVNSDAANAEFSKKAVPLYYTANDEIYWKGTFTQPVVSRISTPYGVVRYINDNPVPVRHGGVDLATSLGTPILAPNHGVVELAEFLQLTGYTIIVEHGGGLKSYFYHMDSVNVKAGDMIIPGQEIGKVGTTGFSTGPHLHYEVKIGRRSLDPFPLFDGTSSIFS